MIRHGGPQKWTNIHATEHTKLADLIDVDNSASHGVAQPGGFAVLQQAARTFENIIREASAQKQRIRALGSGWALTDIAVTDGWLLNTKSLNGCFEISDNFFEASYAPQKRPYVVVAQCGMSIGELNVYLELGEHAPILRALKTSGIGAGQTVAGAISGNTHGSAVKFGSTPDFVVGIHLVTGTGKSLWIERASHPVLNDGFVANLDARLVRDDDIFNAAVVSFGSFGVIAALAIETDNIYELKFPPVRDIDRHELSRVLSDLSLLPYEAATGPYHYEFIFDPWDKRQLMMESSAAKVGYMPGHTVPRPVWIVRDSRGFALGPRMSIPFYKFPFMTSRQKTAFQFQQYRERCILDDVRGTPGQVFTATVTYFEGYNESAFSVSIDDAITMLDTSTRVIQEMNLPCMSQVRVVHPSNALLAFTRWKPKTAIFEFGLVNDQNFRRFERTLVEALKAQGVKHALHWSKNSGLEANDILAMYGDDQMKKWRKAREFVFAGDPALMGIFNNVHLRRTGLA